MPSRQQRSPAVAGIDGGVRLDEAGQQGGDRAPGERPGTRERVADGGDRCPYFGIGVGEGEDVAGEGPGRRADESEVMALVEPDHVTDPAAAVGAHDDDAGAGENVRGRRHEAGSHEEASADGSTAARGGLDTDDTPAPDRAVQGGQVTGSGVGSGAAPAFSDGVAAGGHWRGRHSPRVRSPAPGGWVSALDAESRSRRIPGTTASAHWWCLLGVRSRRPAACCLAAAGRRSAAE